MITDTFLNNIAGLINGESSRIPSHAAFSSSVITADATHTSLPTELDSPRLNITKSRSTNTTTYSFVRTGALASSTGDYLNAVAIIDSVTGGFILSEATVSSLLHTTSFDVEVDWKISVDRI